MRELRSAVRTGALILSMTAKSEAPAAALGSLSPSEPARIGKNPWGFICGARIYFLD